MTVLLVIYLSGQVIRYIKYHVITNL